MFNWKQHSNGLWVPEPEGVLPQSDISTQTDSRKPHWGVMGWSALAQAVATALTLLVAIPGVIFGLNTLREQQKINASQYAVNSIQQRIYLSRYASEVSWFQEVRPSTTQELKDGSTYLQTRLAIQNSSSSPINNVVVETSTSENLTSPFSRGIIHVGDVGPCTRVIVSIPMKDRGGRKFLARTVGAVYFSDSVSSWLKVNGEALKQSETPKFFEQFSGDIPSVNGYSTGDEFTSSEYLQGANIESQEFKAPIRQEPVACTNGA